MVATEPHVPPPAAPRRRLGVGAAVDVLVLCGALAVLAFPLIAKLAADAQPIAPDNTIRLSPLSAGPPGAQLRHLPAVSAGTSDAGARLLLLATTQAARGHYPSAASTAYGALNRARAHGACEPQLNLTVLVMADEVYADDAEDEAARAITACGGEPTAQWLLGQYQSQGDDPSAALDTFQALEQAFPRSAAGWSGEA